MIEFIVPGPPQGKGRPRVGRVAGHARMFTPAKTMAYEGLIANAAHAAMAGAPPLAGPVSLELDIACQVPASWSQRKRQGALDGIALPTTKPDIDNVLKAVCDGCNGVVWQDDRQVVNLKASKRYGWTPGLRVAVRPVDALFAAGRAHALRLIGVAGASTAPAMESW